MPLESASKLWMWLEKVNTLKFIMVSLLVAIMAVVTALAIVWFVTDPTRY
jgi:hypothetical protein